MGEGPQRVRTEEEAAGEEEPRFFFLNLERSGLEATVGIFFAVALIVTYSCSYSNLFLYIFITWLRGELR